MGATAQDVDLTDLKAFKNGVKWICPCGSRMQRGCCSAKQQQIRHGGVKVTAGLGESHGPKPVCAPAVGTTTT